MAKVSRKLLGGPVAGVLQKEGFQFLVRLCVNTDACVPLWRSSPNWSDAGTAIADRVAFEFNWAPSAVQDTSALTLFEFVIAIGDEEQKCTLKADVLHVCQSPTLSMCTLTVGEVDAVFFDQLSIDLLRIFARWNSSQHVPQVSVTKVTHSDLLDESLW